MNFQKRKMAVFRERFRFIPQNYNIYPTYSSTIHGKSEISIPCCGIGAAGAVR